MATMLEPVRTTPATVRRWPGTSPVRLSPASVFATLSNSGRPGIEVLAQIVDAGHEIDGEGLMKIARHESFVTTEPMVHRLAFTSGRSMNGEDFVLDHAVGHIRRLGLNRLTLEVALASRLAISDSMLYGTDCDTVLVLHEPIQFADKEWVARWLPVLPAVNEEWVPWKLSYVLGFRKNEKGWWFQPLAFFPGQRLSRGKTGFISLIDSADPAQAALFS